MAGLNDKLYSLYLQIDPSRIFHVVIDSFGK